MSLNPKAYNRLNRLKLPFDTFFLFQYADVHDGGRLHPGARILAPVDLHAYASPHAHKLQHTQILIHAIENAQFENERYFAGFLREILCIFVT